MKLSIFLIGYLLSTTCLQASPVSFECPCRQPKPPKTAGSFYQDFYAGCGCGGGGGGAKSEEIPPDQG